MVDESDYLVSIGSSLAYEALSRKKKVAFFPIRKELLIRKGFDLDFQEYDFGWPTRFKKKGSFWTHLNDTNEFKRVLDFLINISDQKWLKLINNLNDDFKIPYDKNNSVFVNFLKSHNIKIQGSKI